ncbi:AEC family transporter [Brevibacillus sp. H7]|uniref:AEC family transporter n=1 Tax=Brevibacillus sp. H7 TaxID=3349138 RepID=UPI003816DBA2
MIEITTLLTSVFIMAVIVGIGCLLGLRHPLTADSRQLMIAMIVNVGMPCIILDGVFQTTIDGRLMTQIFVIFGVSVLFNCLGIFLGWLGAGAMKMPDKKRREMAILSGLGNTGFIGLPLCAALFGPKGALLAAVFDAGLDFTIWTVGVMMLQDKWAFSLKGLKAMVNIPMIAIVSGLVVAALGLTPPDAVKHLTGTLAKIASPLAMMYVGMLLPGLLKNKRRVSLPQLGLPLSLKLFVFPLVAALLLSLFAIDDDITRIAMIQVAMPTIALASILFARYAADEEMGAMTTVFSTLLGILTIPAVILVGSFILQHNP